MKQIPKKWKNFVDDTVKAFGDKSVSEAAYYAAQTFGTNTEIRDKVISELKGRGYNAMTDEASVGGQNGWAKEGSDPLIIFDSSNNLYKQNTKAISDRDEKKALSKYQKWQKKVGKSSGAWSAI